MNEADLKLLNEAALIGELNRRFPNGVIVAYVDLAGRMTRHFHGNILGCLGMCSAVEHFIHDFNGRHQQQQQPKDVING